MRKLREVVRDYLNTTRLCRMFRDGWDITNICDDSRAPIWETCLTEGLDKSIEKQTSEVIRRVNLAPLEEGFPVV